VFTQTDISKFFSASRDFRGGDSLGFLQLGPSLTAIFVSAAVWQNHDAVMAAKSAA